ncbi:MAG: prefoldin subunit beta [Nanoarchaeota archaeon]|nr:prefoldin subunit beta [Nanoarchaeota archaeon]
MADQKKIQELQILEQNLQGILMQRQAFELEINETENALKEIDKSNEDVYKIVGQIMLKTGKETVTKELEEKNKVFLLRVKSIEKQENTIKDQIEKLRSELQKK